ncbi:MAG: MOSC domain-containing protein [Acidimicrobiia bacterium]|nr:MOSC domain-containing protein [Acidimicrobiia bacterium]
MSHIHLINVSDGGVPKLPVDTAEVGLRGLTTDRQADTIHHGSPDQALCLYSLEVIEALGAEGHPIFPGAAGENLTISGLDWAGVTEGDRFRLGDDVVIEVTFPATPCSKNAEWFVDRNFKRMSHDLHPGSSRTYARVLQPGSVSTGDPVVAVVTAVARSEETP